MSIRQMLPVGTHLRRCIVCGYPITAKSDEMTAHELECWGIKPEPKPEVPQLARHDEYGKNE